MIELGSRGKSPRASKWPNRIDLDCRATFVESVVKPGEAGAAYAIALCWLALHFFVYALVLRHRSTFQTERGIFLYHLVSALLITTSAAFSCVLFASEPMFAAAVGIVAAHGIYSVSFLELWSLSQGSYSLSIMAGTRKVLSRADLVDIFSRIGNEKKEGRIAGLSSSGLVHRDGGSWRLTAAGRVLANLLRVFLWLANIRERG
jgi:hypothetical protein